MRLTRTTVISGVAIALMAILPTTAASTPQRLMTSEEFVTRAHERGSLVTEARSADHNCVRVLLERDPRQPNRLSSAGAFNICDFTLWPSLWAYFEDVPAGIHQNTDVVAEVRPGDGIVYNFGPLGRYAPWGSQFCGQLIVPSTGGSSIFGPDCVII